MRAAQPIAKFYAEACEPETHAFIDVFHRWIQQRKLDELLIDVADYTHVHRGPGVLLVGHDSYYGMDEGEGRLGMLFRRRRGGPKPVAEGLLEAVRAALAACTLIEAELGSKVRFGAGEVLVGFDDRLHLPNDAATHALLRPTLEGLAASLYPSSDVTMSHHGSPRDGFRARLRCPEPVSVAELLERLS